ncbi:MAG: hypothetical protein LBR22_04715 [Desulfovibrio sp.]|nr:hypothetical protein [Desulfovibrio sp.]
MSFVYHRKTNGTVYVYEQVQHWDKEKKGPMPKQKYLGKLDPVTNEIISTNGKRRSISENSMDDGSCTHNAASSAQHMACIENKVDNANEEHAPISFGKCTEVPKVRTYGTYTLFDSISNRLNITNILNEVFDTNLTQLILSVIYYLVELGRSLCRIETWSASHVHPCGNVLTSQRVTELLDQITSDKINRFLSIWSRTILESE